MGLNHFVWLICHLKFYLVKLSRFPRNFGRLLCGARALMRGGNAKKGWAILCFAAALFWLSNLVKRWRSLPVPACVRTRRFAGFAPDEA
jgi:hypothetical protein